ncbi:MAG: LysM peptidoglycan-binding domain-containing protein, partial [Microbacterium sp.]
PAPPAGAYTVAAGDTISGIASRHGVTTQAVLAANGLTMSSIIYPGQTLAMPGAAASASPLVSAPAPAPPPAPAPGYVVQAGDTISGVASRHGVSTQAVLATNGLAMSSIIYPGQTLAVPTATAAPAAVSVPGLDAEQIENARLIIQVGRELGVPDRGIAIALGTAMQESWIRNLNGGDRDSLGLFQQRPSTGWGTPEEIRDRVRSIRVFYGGSSDPNGDRTRGLLDVPGWQNLSFADAAQTVQISAHPDRYAAWEQPAYAWLAALG